ncbi:Ppx/GppA family phosphatase [Allosphingosinicella sp.]|uniref:Ppx/GppA phosphatase family protein n=1 Tax=Allosphingosinicella sp. TaxID=2823234 RepID=UPI002FC1C1F0
MEKPIAIVDIGSNSIRLVVYSGATRSPSVIFNEKVMAGLGRGVVADGALAEDDQQRALGALARFRILTRQMGARRVRAVATAAVRDASNGAAFLAKVRELGFDPEILPGDREGFMAGQGVLSGIPWANGLVGDLGGGSLELVEVADGEVGKSASLPLGVLRIAPLAKQGKAVLAKQVAKALDGRGLRKRGEGRPFYLVGGSWRALARLDMLLVDYPLPITHQYRMEPGRLDELADGMAGLDMAVLKRVPSFSMSRWPTLPDAHLLLEILVKELQPSELIVSSFGIREGLLFDALDGDHQRRDPLIEAAREVGSDLGRFPGHGALLDRWIAPIFEDDTEAARLRLAACLLSDIAWQAHPDFRAERGVDMALYGNWVGIDAPGRLMLAQALFSHFGGGKSFASLDVARLCGKEALARAALWGLAMRLGQRLSGGVAASLERSRLVRNNGVLRLELRKRDEALYGEAVERRFNALAAAMGCKAEMICV